MPAYRPLENGRDRTSVCVDSLQLMLQDPTHACLAVSEANRLLTGQFHSAAPQTSCPSLALFFLLFYSLMMFFLFILYVVLVILVFFAAIVLVLLAIPFLSRVREANRVLTRTYRCCYSYCFLDIFFIQSSEPLSKSLSVLLPRRFYTALLTLPLFIIVLPSLSFAFLYPSFFLVPSSSSIVPRPFFLFPSSSSIVPRPFFFFSFSSFSLLPLRFSLFSSSSSLPPRPFLLIPFYSSLLLPSSFLHPSSPPHSPQLPHHPPHRHTPRRSPQQPEGPWKHLSVLLMP